SLTHRWPYSESSHATPAGSHRSPPRTLFLLLQKRTRQKYGDGHEEEGRAHGLGALQSPRPPRHRRGRSRRPGRERGPPETTRPQAHAAALHHLRAAVHRPDHPELCRRIRRPRGPRPGRLRVLVGGRPAVPRLPLLGVPDQRPAAEAAHQPLHVRDRRAVGRRAHVTRRVKANGTGVENKTFKWPQFREAMRDMKTWLLFLFAVASNSPNGGLTTDHGMFQGLVIKGMGFSTLETTLIQMPSGGVQLVLCPLACFFASHYPNVRITIMLMCLAPFLAGILGLWLIGQSHPYGRLACLWISFAYTATWTLSMFVATANTAGHTKKITTNAMLLIGCCLGNLVGPFFFKAEQALRYPLGVAMMIFCIGVQVACLCGLY
ncbi:major facilitator superfamily domain-containing protein, partial [Colletotrichum cereale]